MHSHAVLNMTDLLAQKNERETQGEKWKKLLMDLKAKVKPAIVQSMGLVQQMIELGWIDH